MVVFGLLLFQLLTKIHGVLMDLYNSPCGCHQLEDFFFVVQEIRSYVPGPKLLTLGIVILPLVGNPYKHYYWVDDHPLSRNSGAFNFLRLIMKTKISSCDSWLVGFFPL